MAFLFSHYVVPSSDGDAADYSFDSESICAISSYHSIEEGVSSSIERVDPVLRHCCSYVEIAFSAEEPRNALITLNDHPCQDYCHYCYSTRQQPTIPTLSYLNYGGAGAYSKN